MRRLWIILLAIAAAMAMTLPATAKQPPKPDPDPVPTTTYVATIERLSANGVDTTCVGPIEMTRTDERRGAVTHFESEGAQLNIKVDGLAFEGGSIGGCAGNEVQPEYFRITFDGDQIAMLWIFDVVIEETTVVINAKNGKTRTEETRTDFRMGGPYNDDDFATWGHTVDDDGVITTSGAGTFSFVHYESGRDPVFLPLEDGLQDASLAITLIPIPTIP